MTSTSSTSEAATGLPSRQPGVQKPPGLTAAGIIDWLCEHWDQPDEGSGRPAAAGRTSPTAGSGRAGPPSGWRSAAAPRHRPVLTQRDAIYPVMGAAELRSTFAALRHRGPRFLAAEDADEGFIAPGTRWLSRSKRWTASRLRRPGLSLQSSASPDGLGR
jgi:hypothetical protein